MPCGSLGGFAALVRVTHSTIWTGFAENATSRNEFRTNASIELEGLLLGCHYRDLATRLTRSTKSSVTVDLKFNETPKGPRYAEDDDRYIGTIHLRDRMHDQHAFNEADDVEVYAFVHIELPLTLLQLFVTLGARQLKVDTIHDLVRDPTQDQKADHVIAFVKRIHFKPYWD